jgi:hypothetical protein
MNKMKKLNIGVPYRDARVFFFRFLQDKYPDLIPAGFETRKPAGKDVNALVGQIAMERPELLDKFGPEFDAYSREEVPGGLDRVSQFLNTAATMRQGKGVRQTAAAAAQTGGIKKDYSKLTAQEIADATTDAIKKKEAAFDAGDDVSDEKLLLKTAVGSVIAQLGKENVNQEALDNVAAAVTKINTLAEFERFLDYIADFEEYSVIYQYLLDTIDVIETNLGDIQAQKEDEEYEQEKADLNKDGEISEYEEARGKAITDAMKKEKQRAGQSHARAVADHYEDQESNIENTPLEELSILSPEEYEEVQNFENFNPNEWGYNTLQKFYFRKREGGEDGEYSTSQYMSKAPVEKREEAEEVRMSQLEINQHLAVQERQRVQNLYAQQRRNTHGY